MRFVLDDISKVTDEAIKNRPMTALGRMVLWCLRRARDPDELIQRLRGVRDLLSLRGSCRTLQSERSDLLRG